MSYGIELAPATRAAIAQTIEDIAAALRHPPPPIDGDPLLAAALYNRDPGIALFYAYLDRATPRAAWRKLAARFLGNAADQIAAASHRPFFTFGFPGAAWALQHLAGWIVDLPSDALDEIDDSLVTLVEKAHTVSFDLHHGLVGHGLYALERLPAPGARRLLGAVVARLGRMGERRGAGLAWKMVPAKWVEHADLWRVVQGVYSADVHHGSAGVVGVLGGAIAARVAEGQCRRLFRGAAAWSLATCDAKSARSGIATTWVGDLGIATVIYTAARAAAMEDIATHSLAVARQIAKRAAATVREPGMQLGVAGALHMFHRLHAATGEGVFADAARRYLGRLLRRRRVGRGLAGFAAFTATTERRILRDQNFPIGWLGHPGLARGVAGIGLALVSVLHGQEPAWDRAFLLSCRSTQDYLRGARSLAPATTTPARKYPLSR
jgi:hypothetical protein